MKITRHHVQVLLDARTVVSCEAEMAAREEQRSWRHGDLISRDQWKSQHKRYHKLAEDLSTLLDGAMEGWQTELPLIWEEPC